jgi:hypothetical protein
MTLQASTILIYIEYDDSYEPKDVRIVLGDNTVVPINLNEFDKNKKMSIGDSKKIQLFVDIKTSKIKYKILNDSEVTSILNNPTYSEINIHHVYQLNNSGSSSVPTSTSTAHNWFSNIFKRRGSSG